MQVFLEKLTTAQRQLVLFCVVGGITTAFNLGIAFFLCLWLQSDLRTANTAGYWSGVVLGYWLNKNYTFQAQASGHKHLLPYLAVYAVSWLGGLSFVSLFSLEDPLLKAMVLVASVVISTVCNFLGTKFLVFRK